MDRIEVENAPQLSGAVLNTAQDGRDAAWHCRRLEENQILYFPIAPFAVAKTDLEFLRNLHQTNTALHKNISYRPATGALAGFQGSVEERDRVRSILKSFSASAGEFVTRFLSPYAPRIAYDFASYRPLEEEGRDLPLHKRNDLLHVDAFPSRPTRGGRILRLFVNVHASRSRVWLMGEGFPVLAARLASDAGLEKFASPGVSAFFGQAVRLLGKPVRSPYDRFMLHFHDYLKENASFQRDSPKTRLEFPALSAWMVFTDGVLHAVLSGQHALEQTFIIPRDALLAPQSSPIGVIEKLCGRPLA
jgi:hypothetical protein